MAVSAFPTTNYSNAFPCLSPHSTSVTSNFVSYWTADFRLESLNSIGFEWLSYPGHGLYDYVQCREDETGPQICGKKLFTTLLIGCCVFKTRFVHANGTKSHTRPSSKHLPFRILTARMDPHEFLARAPTSSIYSSFDKYH